jgi:probable RNA-binding protein EIF1AD
LEEQMLVTPTVEENQTVARVVKLHGSNIVQVESPKTNGDGSRSKDEADLEECLCLLPAKFSKRFWVKRGNFVVIEFTVSKEHSTSGKIKGSITHVLYGDQVKQLKKDKSVWPEDFTDEVLPEEGKAVGNLEPAENKEYRDDDEDSSSDEGPPLPPNPNRPKGYVPRKTGDSDTESTSSD